MQLHNRRRTHIRYCTLHQTKHFMRHVCSCIAAMLQHLAGEPLYEQYEKRLDATRSC